MLMASSSNNSNSSGSMSSFCIHNAMLCFFEHDAEAAAWRQDSTEAVPNNRGMTHDRKSSSGRGRMPLLRPDPVLKQKPVLKRVGTYRSITKQTIIWIPPKVVG